MSESGKIGRSSVFGSFAIDLILRSSWEMNAILFYFFSDLLFEFFFFFLFSDSDLTSRFRYTTLSAIFAPSTTRSGSYIRIPLPLWHLLSSLYSIALRYSSLPLIAFHLSHISSHLIFHHPPSPLHTYYSLCSPPPRSPINTPPVISFRDLFISSSLHRSSLEPSLSPYLYFAPPSHGKIFSTSL